MSGWVKLLASLQLIGALGVLPAAAAAGSYETVLGPTPVNHTTRTTLIGEGAAVATLSGNTLTISGTFQGMAAPASDAHIMMGEAIGIPGDAILDLAASPAPKGSISGSFRLNPAQLAALRAGLLYIQINSSAALGWQMGLHAIGDAAIAQTIVAYDKALAQYPGLDHTGMNRRWFTDHFTIMPPDETMRTMARDGIAAAAQPNFGYTLDARYHQTLDDWRITHNNPVGSPLRFGIFVVFGSDNLPVDPRVGLYYATTRKGPDGLVHGLAEEGVSRREALRLYTAAGAYLSWEDKVKGTIEKGKLADMVVLDKDPLTVPDEELLTLKVEQTYLGGKLVYAAPFLP